MTSPEAREQSARLAAAIEHTLLAPNATTSAIERVCHAAREHRFGGVCVNPSYVSRASELLRGSGVGVVSVVGFPLGSSLTRVKALECELVVAHGAAEIDMVMALGAAAEGRWDDVEDDIRAVIEAARGRPVKVILETALLDDASKRRACTAAETAGAAFVKTSTGFASGGATVEDVALLHAAVRGRLGVKASGGIRSRDQALRLLDAGATRLGTSAGPALLAQD